MSSAEAEHPPSLPSPYPEARTYTGSCHCGFITYTISNLLISSSTATRCNCTHCHKSNYFIIRLPLSNLSLLSPSSLSEIKFYQHSTRKGKFYFCPTCAVKPFGTWPENNKDETEGLVVFVNLVTLDDVDLSRLVCKKYYNCRGDLSDIKVGEVPWEGGAI